ncbi:MAG: division plane positioning ATPase MipZ [Pseudomonadota bacterium]
MSTKFLKDWFAKPIRPRVITLGNQKGGSGKTTTAMHILVGLMNCGYGVGSIDLDGRQATLTHFVENRRRQSRISPLPIDMPEHHQIESSLEATVADAEEDEAGRLADTLNQLQHLDYIVIDTPGHDNFLARLGHILADTLITPMNDSFLDLDVLVRLDNDGQRITGPSSYSVAVLERWGLRMLVSGTPIDWLVIRNRLAHLDNRNNRKVEELLQQLAPRLGYRTSQGFGERVIYRELFPMGLTLLDPFGRDAAARLSKSRTAARDEVWSLLTAIGLSEQPQASETWNKKMGLSLSISRYAQPAKEREPETERESPEEPRPAAP